MQNLRNGSRSLRTLAAGPEKKYPPLTGFDLLSKTGNAYEARKNDSEKEWQKQAYSVLTSRTPSQILPLLGNLQGKLAQSPMRRSQMSHLGNKELLCWLQDAYNHEEEAKAAQGPVLVKVS